MLKKTAVNILRLVVSTLPFAMAAQAAPVMVTPWEAAEREDCTQAYAKFVLENPDSPYVTEALCRIETLESLSLNVTSRVAPTITPDMRFGDGASRLMNI